MSVSHGVSVGSVWMQFVASSMLLQRATSGSMVLLQPGSMLMSFAHVATEGHVNVVCAEAWSHLDVH